MNDLIYRVVTGVKLVKKNHMVHLQIQEGKLLARGEIDPSSVSWKPVDNFTITDNNVLKNRDFHSLSWDRRAIDLDDLTGKDDQLLTGMSFELFNHQKN